MEANRRYEAQQPGLEVVPQEQLQYGQQPEVRNPYEAKEVVVPKYADQHTPPSGYASQYEAQYEAPIAVEATPVRPRRRRKWWLIIGGVVALVVVIAAVLGGVLGSRLTATQTGDGSSAEGAGAQTPTLTAPTGSPTATATGLPQLARAGSPLTVTAMRKTDGGLDIMLYYQDKDNTLGYARCDTSRVLKGNESCWKTNGTFHTFSNAKTQMAVTNLVWETRFKPQTQLFYTGSQNRMLGTSFNDQSNPPIIEDSINNKQYTTGPDSSVAAYWPWSIYQNAEAGLVHIRNNPPAFIGPSDTWDQSTINITALAGSKIAMVPVSTNATRIAGKGGYGVFYQSLDSRLSAAVTHLFELDSTYPLSWPTNLPLITLPKRNAIAAFSTARQSDALQRVDTHVLYLDAESNINMLYTDSSTDPPNWRTAQPAALRGVDAGTNIACTTMSTSSRNEAFNEMMLEPVSEDVRCYFQKGGKLMEGKLMEGKLDGVDWKVGEVAIEVEKEA
ncbi:hypothetical protein B0T25DRAFT_357290 [Lasiosphaeria hispida]|uniref:Fucose-specific lectin n=1 Tax=Lasiosphaeria hispida TaxID=260671 RepID=A0AAJ0H7E5_9PEZI|nr:hypothetical protein B0T25DRAFT_357290 [Lasiosphaeria hispida]